MLEKVKEQSVKMRYAVMPLMVAAITTAPAFATNGSGSADTHGLSYVMGFMSDVTDLCTHVWTMLTSNTYFTLFLAIGLLSAGIGVFRRIKRTARH